MKNAIVSALAAAVSLAAAACSPAMIQPERASATESSAASFVSSSPAEGLVWREPLSASEHPADDLLAANMLITHHTRMALPEGWRFQRPQKDDPEGLQLRIHDTGGNLVRGALSFKFFDFAISPVKATNVCARGAMSDLADMSARRTEIDGNEAHVLTGMSRETGQQNISTLIYEGGSSVRAIHELTLLADPRYLARHPGVPLAIANSFKAMPGQMAERRIKGSFSFKCDDGTLDWLDDSDRQWQSAGFSVIGKAGDAAVVIDISQVSTTRFQDFFKLEKLRPGEKETELHFAGKVYLARAISSGKEAKNAHIAFFFKHEGKDFLLSIFRRVPDQQGVDAGELHNDEGIRRALDSNFYWNG